MSRSKTFAGRLQSRWRKWRRDPAAFMDDLPWPPVRMAGLLALHAAALAENALDGAGRAAAREWRTAHVALRAGGEGADFSFAAESGAPPAHWPRRVLLRSVAGPAIVVAVQQQGVRMSAAEVRADRPGVLDLAAAPAAAKAYGLDEGGQPPERFEAEPLGRAALVRVLRGQGLTLAQALRTAWPPAERRPEGPAPRAYQAWIARNEPDAAALHALRRRFPPGSGPLISILTPVHDPRPADLRAALASVRSQAYADWRLCLADDGSASTEVRRLLQETAAGDPRVRLVRLERPQGVAAATNAALQLAEGEIALFLDHDDLLAPHALAAVAEAFRRHPEAAAVYSDEDVVDAHGRRSDPVFKPDLDRERLLAQNYVNHLFAVRLDLLRRLGGVRTGLDGAQDHDLVLRVIEAGAGPVAHIPQVLYHWRVFPGGRNLSQQRPERLDAARVEVVRQHLARMGRAAALDRGPRGHLVVRRPMPEPAPAVTAIVPTRDRPGLVRACVAGLLDQTDYPELKVCIVDNGSRTPAALELLERLARNPRVEVLRIEGPFNFSALNNAAAARTASPLLAFVNDDVMVVEPGWLKALVALAAQPDVGATGAKLFYPDGRLQHAGLILGVGPQRVAGHEFRGAPGDSPGPQNRLLVTREASAVTAACMVVERRKFEAVGGFDEAAFPVAFNDVDLCLRLGEAGYRTVWTPQARLLHLESATRGSDRTEAAAKRFAEEVARMKARWGPQLQADPYYNPNLTLLDESFALAARPRG
jgi:GT2 family glycosyltransferase